MSRVERERLLGAEVWRGLILGPKLDEDFFRVFLRESESWMPPDQFHLVYFTQGTDGMMEDDRTLGEYNIDRDATINLIMRLTGC